MFVATSYEEQGKSAVDPWTAVNMAVGLAAGLSGAPWKSSLLLVSFYELLKHRPIGRTLKLSQESQANSAVDLAVFALGWWLGDRYRHS